MASDWPEANRDYLLLALRAIENALRRAAAVEPPEMLPSAEEDLRALAEAGSQMPAPPAIESLAEAFGLSPFERSVVILCAGVELDPRFARSDFGGAGGGGAFPTFSQAMAALPEAHWNALAPTAPCGGGGSSRWGTGRR
ncbi:MAG: hypothetical protein U0790_12100 [Isosphaeraceae bacterium]